MVVGDILFPRQSICFSGAGLGWVVIMLLLASAPEMMVYREAIRYMRKNEYPEAIESINKVIAAHPGDPKHRRFRASLYMMAGDLDQSQIEYQALVRDHPEYDMGYSGLAEIAMQQGRYQQAYDYMQQANKLAPGNLTWHYYLGMLADRLNQPETARDHLEKTFKGYKHNHRDALVGQLWLARSYFKLDNRDAAQAHLDQMRKHAAGLKEWKLIFASEQAGPVRHLYEADVELAQRLLNGTAALEQLKEEPYHA
jgi:tetratricopeptide (TPR) repeat protein